MEMNLLDDDGWLDRTWPPERAGYVWRRKRVAGEHLGAGLIELPPGQSTFPYHYELGNDELLVVVSGTPTLRAPDGERELEPGDCILFPSGPDGRTQADEPIRRPRPRPARLELRAAARGGAGGQRKDDGALGRGAGGAALVLARRGRGLLGRRSGRVTRLDQAHSRREGGTELRRIPR